MSTDAYFLFRPEITDAASPSPTDNSPNIYRLKRFDGEMVVLYQRGENSGNSFFTTKGVAIEDLLGGQWFAWQISG
jgi:hypothetical protein